MDKRKKGVLILLLVVFTIVLVFFLIHAYTIYTEEELDEEEEITAMAEDKDVSVEGQAALTYFKENGIYLDDIPAGVVCHPLLVLSRMENDRNQQ